MNIFLERELIIFWGSYRFWEFFLKGVKIVLNNVVVVVEFVCENFGLINIGFNIFGLEFFRFRKVGLEYFGLKFFLSIFCD